MRFRLRTVARRARSVSSSCGAASAHFVESNKSSHRVWETGVLVCGIVFVDSTSFPHILWKLCCVPCDAKTGVAFPPAPGVCLCVAWKIRDAYLAQKPTRGHPSLYLGFAAELTPPPYLLTLQGSGTQTGWMRTRSRTRLARARRRGCWDLRKTRWEGEKNPTLIRLSARLLTRICCLSGSFRSQGGTRCHVS